MPELFSAGEPFEAVPSERLVPDSVEFGGATLRARRMRLDVGLLAGQAAPSDLDAGLREPGSVPAAFTLNLFDDAAYEVVGLTTAPTSAGYSLSGQLEGVPFGSVTLVVNGDIVVGTVHSPSATYTIRSVGDGRVEIREIDPSTLPPPGEPIEVQAPAPDGQRTQAPRPQAATATSTATPATIDVMVVYTERAKNRAGGRARMEAEIDQWVAFTNSAYVDSGVNQRLYLVLAEQIAYRGTDYGQLLTRVRKRGDGHLDQVHARRDAVGADIVTVIDTTATICGEAYMNTTIGSWNSPYAFNFVSYRCGADTYAHELGHTMGLNHDRYAHRSNLSNRPHAHSYGYVNQAALEPDSPASAQWRTIMAYDNQCADNGRWCPTIARFSNADLTYGGDALGVADDQPSHLVTGPADARRTMNTSARSVANYRATAVTKALVSRLTPADAHTRADTLTWQVAFSPRGVENVDAADFVLLGAGRDRPPLNVAAVDGGTRRWNVTATGLGGLNATVSLDFAAGQDIADEAGTAVPSAWRAGSERSYTLDNDRPGVLSLTRHDPVARSTEAAALMWRVVFDEEVVGVDPWDFELTGTTATLAVAAAADEAGILSKTTFEVTARGGDLATLSGTVALRFAADQNIEDALGNSLDPALSTGAQTSYSVRVPAPAAKVPNIGVRSAVGGLEVSWAPVTGASGYKVQWKPRKQARYAPKDQAAVAAGVTSFVIGRLAGDLEYAVRVIATKGGAEDGTPSDEAIGTPSNGAVAIAAVAPRVSEGGPASFRVTLSAPVGYDIRVPVSVTESADTILGTPPTEVRIGAGHASALLTVATDDDTVVEPGSLVTATVLSVDGYYSAAASGSAHVSVRDDDVAVFAVTASPAEMPEGGYSTVSVSVSNGVTFATDQSIALSTSGTAASADFKLQPTTLTLEVGLRSATAIVDAIDDDLGEVAETVVVEARHNGTTLGSATVSIAASDMPLTAAFGAAPPASHAGAGTVFQVRYRFSEPLADYSYLDFRDTALAVTNATVTNARRTVPGRNDGWEIDVSPGSAADVVLVLEETRSCDRPGALCTQDGRRLANRLAHTVSGPTAAPAIDSAGPFSVREGDTAVAKLTATDRDSAPGELKWSIPPGTGGGADREHFRLAAHGALAFASAKDFEAPDDAGANGVYEIAVQVTDGDNPVTAALRVVLANVNEAPTAHAGPDRRVAEGAQVTLTGAGVDPDAGDTPETLTFQWRQIDRGAHRVDLSKVQSASATFAAPVGLTEDAVLSFGLTVTDDDGLSSQDEVAIAVEPATPLTGSFIGVPQEHSGRGTITLRIRFSEPISSGYVTLRDASLAVANGSVRHVRRVAGRSDLWEIEIEPSSAADLVVTLPATRDCAAPGAVCTADGRPLRTRLQATIPARLPVISVAAVESPVSEGELARFTVSRTGPTTETLTVQTRWEFSDGSQSHTGRLVFPVGRRTNTSSHSRYDDNVVREDLTVTLTLEDGAGYTLSGQARSAQAVVEDNDVADFTLSVNPAQVAEGESATVRIEIADGVTFSEDQKIVLDFAGSAGAGDGDFTVSNASPTLSAGARSATAVFTAAADSDEEGNETIAVTATHAGKAAGQASVTILNRDSGALTARFVGMPERHDGETPFAFELRFSEEVATGYASLQAAALQVTGGAVGNARRLEPPLSLRWEITVNPHSAANVLVVLPVTSGCGAVGAVCTVGGKRLSRRLEATVRGSAAQPVNDGFSLAAENSSPSGIWSDGETAWVADVDDARLYAYRRWDGERAPARDIATGPAPMGLWSDGETLWVAQLGGGLRAHRLAGGSRLPRRDLAVQASAAPAGVWSDGEIAWVSEWLGDTMHAYRLSDGKRAAGRDIKLAGENLLPAGLWSDGRTLWVADWSERVLAYRLSDGAREPTRDIVAGAADEDPSGLWAGGQTLLFTSWKGAEVRARPLPAPSAADSGRAETLPGGVAPILAIEDPALRAAVEAALGKVSGEAVSPDELAGLQALDARNRGVRTLAGLEGAVSLEELDLGFNPLVDLWPLASLPALVSLNLDGAAQAPFIAAQRHRGPGGVAGRGIADRVGRGRQPRREPVPAGAAGRAGGAAGRPQPHRRSLAAGGAGGARGA